MLQLTNIHSDVDIAAEVAAEAFGDLYRAVTGATDATVRAHIDEDAILLLMRFDASDVAEAAFMPMPAMIAAAVLARTGQILSPGNLSISPERGLAVIALHAVRAFEAFEDDPFSLESIWDERDQIHAERIAS